MHNETLTRLHIVTAVVGNQYYLFVFVCAHAREYVP
jgi:hypothetical protein